MDDLISRQAAIDALHEYFTDGFDSDKWWNSTHVIQALMNVPSAQPEIVRCKDCRWYKENYSWNGKEHYICAREAYEPVRSECDFCSRGERKTDG